MTIEVLVPDSDDSGWTGGGTFADIDNGISTPSGVALVASVSGGEETVLLGIVDSVVVDGDTVATVTLKARARTTSAQNDSLRVQLRIGGTLQGSAVDITLGGSYATLSFNDVDWNSDWTAAELDGMTWDITSRQAGMPGNRGHEVDEIEVEIDYTAGSGPQNIAVNQASETDSSGIITPDQPAAGQNIAVGQAAETDSAGTATPQQNLTVAVGQTSETDSAGVISPAIDLSVVVNQSVETDSASTITPFSPVQVPVGQALETDISQVITPFVPSIVLVGISTESDTANAIGAGLPVNVGQSVETNTAGVINPFSPVQVPVGQALESDTAQAIIPDQNINVNTASETNTAQVIIADAGPVPVGIATEVDSSSIITPFVPLIIAVNQTAESDSANQVVPLTILNIPVGIASETDSANVVTPGFNQSVSIGVSLESDISQNIVPFLKIPLQWNEQCPDDSVWANQSPSSDAWTKEQADEINIKRCA